MIMSKVTTRLIPFESRPIMAAPLHKGVAPTRAIESVPSSAGAVTATTNTVRIGWIDISCLTRECLPQAVTTALEPSTIVPFESVRDCIQHSDMLLDLIVYHSHDSASVDLDDVAALGDAFSSVPLVVLSDATSMEPTRIREVLIRGASGFILTSRTGLKGVISGLKLVGLGGTFVPKEFLFTDQQPLPRQTSEPGRLTQREIAVLGLMKHAKRNKVIAYELGLSESTVKVHVRQIMLKMGAANRTQAALNADSILIY
jgi:DNA-binding NarL/FixJ family response regulator